MTRGQVAKALGRSLATVRRLEGTLLFPRRDYAGVWRFNPKKVAELVKKVKAGKRLSPSFRMLPNWPELRGVKAKQPESATLASVARDIDQAMRALRKAQRLLR